MLSNGLAILSAPRHRGAATLAGALYTTSATTAGPQRRILPIETIPASLVGQSLGSSSAASARFIVSGARGDVARANGGGSVYVYDARSQRLIRKIFPNDPSFADNFGFRVATGGPYLAASAPFADDNGNSSGSVYVFDAASGNQLFKLVPRDIGVSDLFGIDLAIDGTTLVVGAGFANRPVGGVDAGAAYVYDLSNGQLLATLESPSPEAGARFGEGVAIHGAHIFIGAPIATNPRGQRAGLIHVFDRRTLLEVARLSSSDGVTGDGLGQDISVSGDTVIAGAQGVDTRGNLSGAAYVFTLR